MSELPAPLVAEDVDCTDLDGFMLNVERLMASELVALASHEAIAAALFLWCRAWKQKPAASLPNDDRVLAAFAKLPLQRFKKLRDDVMRGFVLCSDGRFYHRTLAEEATRAYERKQAFKKRRETDAERLRNWRSKPKGNDSGNASRNADETRFVQEGQDGTGTGQVYTSEPKGSSVLGASAPPAKRKAQLPTDFDLTPERRLTLLDCNPNANPPNEFAQFCDHHRSRGNTMLDWDAAWRTWCRNSKTFSRGHANGKPSGSPLDQIGEAYRREFG